MADLPWYNPRKLLGAWTPTTYAAEQPPFVNITQVGSVVELTVRGDDGLCTRFSINRWWMNNLSKVLAEADRQFEPGLEERIFQEHRAKERSRG